MNGFGPQLARGPTVSAELVRSTFLDDALRRKGVSLLDEPASECPDCQARRDRFQAIGLGALFLTATSFGVLAFVTLPVFIVLVILSNRPCQACRDRRPRKTDRR